MFVANFLTGPGTNHSQLNFQLSLGEYIQSKISSRNFLENMSMKWKMDLVKGYYFGGTKYVSKSK